MLHLTFGDHGYTYPLLGTLQFNNVCVQNW